MALTKSQAIVLHHRDQGETSRIVTLFTLLFGKTSVIAKGSRSLKSHHGAALEPFTHVDVVFYKKETRDLQFLSQADILNPFARIHGQLGRIALASIPCEIVERHEVVGYAGAALFRLLLETLTALNDADGGLRNIVRAFQIKFAGLSGFKPELAHCARCGKETIETFVTFDFASGSYCCSSCDVSAGLGVRMSGYTLQVLRFLQSAAVRRATAARLYAEQGVEIDQWLLRFLGYHMESLHYLSSVKHLQQLEESIKIK
jgi:DNA repair protein RecO (recombination protein O)